LLLGADAHERSVGAADVRQIDLAVRALGDAAVQARDVAVFGEEDVAALTTAMVAGQYTMTVNRDRLLNAQNDPFLPSAALPNAAEVSDAVTLEFPKTGGHVGFVSGKFPGHLEWLPRRIMKFFSHPS